MGFRRWQCSILGNEPLKPTMSTQYGIPYAVLISGGWGGSGGGDSFRDVFQEVVAVSLDTGTPI